MLVLKGKYLRCNSIEVTVTKPIISSLDQLCNVPAKYKARDMTIEYYKTSLRMRVEVLCTVDWYTTALTQTERS
jgi:hypothetical protein